MRKFIAIISILIILVILQTSFASPANQYSDIDQSWGKETILLLNEKGIIKGYPDGTFQPDIQVQVDEFLKMTLISMGYTLENGKTYWAQPYIDLAIDKGLITSSEFANYKAPITREQMSSIIVNALKGKEIAPSSVAQVESFVRDMDTISYKYKSVVKEAYAFGIISGYPDFTFLPTRTSTRVEASVVIHRLIEPTVRKPFEVTAEFVLKYQQMYSGGGTTSTTTPTTPTTPTAPNGGQYTEPEYTQKISPNGATVLFSTNKIATILKKLPVTLPDYYKGKTFSEVNTLISDTTDESVVASEAFTTAKDFVELQYTRNPSMTSSTYRDQLLYYLKDWWNYGGIKYAPYDFAQTWANETKTWNVEQTMLVATDYTLIHQNERSHFVVRARLFFKYGSHKNPSNINSEIEGVGNIALGKWYYVDADIEMVDPFSNAPVTWKTSQHTLWSINLLNTPKLVDVQ